MIDFGRLEIYRENNRIEAKRALGGLPHSIWETYSAFANTLGGIILLGVEEDKDKSLRAVNLPDPEGMAREFLRLVNDPQKASVNVLSSGDVRVETVNGDRIVVIEVPRADRVYRPVYVDGSPLNTYKRSGEGDHRCTGEEYQAMVRDAAVRTQDMELMQDIGMDVIRAASLRDFRREMRQARPDHAWNRLRNSEFLQKAGAAGIGEDGVPHPTAAGILAFGDASAIRRRYPEFSLSYRDDRCSFDSSSGDWSGNVFDFYMRVCASLGLGDASAFGSPGAREAIREALANCLVNADYYGRHGVSVTRTADEIILSNPGCFRIEVQAARSGGRSDPRNSGLLRMFNLIDVGESSGSGIPKIYSVWYDRGWSEPSIRQRVNPERVEMFLPLTPRPRKSSRSRKKPLKTVAQKEMIISRVTDRVTVSRAEICALLGIKKSRAVALLHELVEEDVLVPEGAKWERRYRLRS